jgi:hypothetical protein
MSYIPRMTLHNEDELETMILDYERCSMTEAKIVIPSHYIAELGRRIMLYTPTQGYLHVKDDIRDVVIYDVQEAMLV